MRKRTPRQHEQDRNRATASGKFKSGPVCEFCGKPAGHNYYSDEESLSIDALGLTLCERKRCITKRDAMSLEERRAVYAASKG